MENRFKFNIAYALIAALLVLVFQEVWTAYRTVERIPYSQFLQMLDDGKLTDIVVRETTVIGTLKEPIDGHTQFTTEHLERFGAITIPRDIYRLRLGDALMVETGFPAVPEGMSGAQALQSSTQTS